MLANYHTHTARCKHAEGEDREYVESAIQAGIKILGFSDHCPWPFPDSYVSGIRMAPSDLDDYFYSLETLKKEYKKELTIYIGFEAEYDSFLNDAQEALLSDYPLDYMILGQHFLGTESDSFYTGSPTSDEAILKDYVDLTIQGMQTGKYLYLAHPDLINYTGPDEIYEKYMLRLCSYLKEKDIPIEINLLGLWTHRNYTSKRFLSIAQKAGNSAVLGIDAHAPEQLENFSAEELGISLCWEFGLPLLEKLEISGK
ncbi:MAG TPA: histidinol phosphate phosphatase [Lachnospiraceae bacterium]|nr:histidinol phosphate phosphatase [Lachnospiraceae bacterium]